jgi:multiple sugar transport system substrate-binding protein
MRFRAVTVGLIAVGLGGLSGCGGSSPAPPEAKPPSFSGVRITVGAVGEPALLKSVLAQRGEWQESRGGEVLVQEKPVDPDSLQGIDVILFPGDRMGDLVDTRALASLADDEVRPKPRAESEEEPADEKTSEVPPDPFDFNDILPAFVDQVARYGTERRALAFGGSALVLAYRRDAMERQANQSAARAKGLTLQPPKTWSQLDTLAQFFQGRDWDGDGQPESGIAVALGRDAEGVGVATYLARAAGLGQHRDQFSFLFDADTMEPRITSPPFLEALQGVVAWKGSGPPRVETFDAEAARRAFRAGEAAFLIDRAERAARWTDPQAPVKVGVAALPGSERVFEPEAQNWEDAAPRNQPSYLPFGGGWLAGVNAALFDRQRAAAVDFVKYLASPETSNRLRADRTFPMLPTRNAQLAQAMPDPRSAPGVDPRQWAQAVAGTLTAARVVPGLRIPQATAYLEDLDNARVAVLQGEPADRALEAAARRWNQRTETLGRQRQLWHYRNSLNSFTTSSEPPPR